MSEDLTEGPFRSASAKVQDAHTQASDELKAKVAAAKSSALGKLTK